MEKFVEAERDCLTICLPDIGSVRDDIDIDEQFFDLHILKQQKDEGWFRSAAECDLRTFPKTIRLH